MKRFWFITLFLLVAVMAAQAQTVKVTFVVNTATVPDTVTPRSNIQLRGDPAPLTWDNATGGKLTHIAGDYWTVTLQFAPGTQLRFKIFADSENDGNTGWEANVGTTSTNREWTVGNADETLPLLFYNTVNNRDQFYTPFTSADSIDVLFRVNVAGYVNFNPNLQAIGVRGGVAPLDWGTSIMLKPETESQNAGQLNYPAERFWSGVIKFPKAAADVPYQFVNTDKNNPATAIQWENELGGFSGNRSLPLKANTPDSTLYWKWFGEVAPIIGGHSTNITVTIRTDVSKAITDRGFQHGDTLEVGTGYFGTANEIQRTRMTRQGFTNIYQATVALVSTVNLDLDYQFYLVKNAADVRENYYDFNFTGSPASRAERRRIKLTGTTQTIEDNVVSEVSPRRQPVFPNQAKLRRNVLVNWEVDLRPAIYQILKGDTLFDIQGTYNIVKGDPILQYGVWMNGPAVGGWSNTGGDWGLGLQGNLAKKLYDDGTNGDRVAGDSIFTRQVLASPDSINIGSKGRAGQVYKFGIRGGDNEGGQGGFGNNHVANIDDNGSTFTIYTQFGSINPAYYDAWDFDLRKPRQLTTKVTFWVNTATVPDTITPRANIQIRGNTAPLTWDNATGGKLKHVSGDYWTTTLEFPSGTDLRFKLFADSENDGNNGWEANVGTGSTNREWKVGNTNETLPLLFYNTVNNRDQFYTPFTSADSIDVLFRVNVAGYVDFNPTLHEIGVRGGTAPLDWGRSILLKPETESQNAGQLNYPAERFWSGVIKFPKAAADVPYQFVNSVKGDPANAVLWENQLGGFGGNRSLPLTANTPDSTLYWKWFGDVPPVIGGHSTTITATIRTDVSKAITDRGFAHGDTLEVGTGYFGSANEVQRTRMARQGFTNIYQATVTLVSTVNQELDYQFYLVKNGADVRENYYDFNFTGSPASRAERRRIKLTGTTQTIEDNVASEVSARRQPVFPNQAKLRRNVLVNWEVDLRPAIYQILKGDTLFDIQGTYNIVKGDPILQYGVWMNGPAVGGWSNTGGDWGLGLQGNLAKKLYDDGTNGDRVAGDSIFTRQVLASPDSINIGSKGRVGQVYKFGIRGGDNEGGQGGFGNNHVANIDDNGSTFTIYTQFGSINPAYYDAWDFDKRKPTTAVKDQPREIPATYVLEQNYPNPFNPETQIRYGIPKRTNVALRIYNLFGQVVATLVEGEQTAGTHIVTWNGLNSAGARVSSGIYFYKLETKDFMQVRKLLLAK
ncbi:MAG: hypothetical protein ALAOOOJD_00871 [bacterium]|nr:hypothetical protein [bacterium]